MTAPAAATVTPVTAATAGQAPMRLASGWEPPRGHRVIATARDPRTLAGLPAGQRLALDVTNPGSITSAVGEAGDVNVLDRRVACQGSGLGDFSGCS